MRMILAIFAVATLACGCTTAYWKDRACDAADVVTATIGMGGGAFAQVGPKPVGYGFILDSFGVEDGKFGVPCYLTALAGVADRFAVYEFDDIRIKRGKLPPLLTEEDEKKSLPIMPHHWTQLRIFAGVTIVSASVGVNLGESLDFALGWLGIDIYGDDAGAKARHPDKAACAARHPDRKEVQNG